MVWGWQYFHIKKEKEKKKKKKDQDEEKTSVPSFLSSHLEYIFFDKKQTKIKDNKKFINYFKILLLYKKKRKIL